MRLRKDAPVGSPRANEPRPIHVTIEICSASPPSETHDCGMLKQPYAYAWLTPGQVGSQQPYTSLHALHRETVVFNAVRIQI